MEPRFYEEILSLTDIVISFLDVTKGAISILYLEFPKIITTFLQKKKKDYSWQRSDCFSMVKG